MNEDFVIALIHIWFKYLLVRGVEYGEGTTFLLESPNSTQERVLKVSYVTTTHTLNLIAYEMEL
jgi:hypothetical protein